jgi:hypothetical protein
MTNSDWIAILALLVAGGALALELRRWFESRARLSITVMADMVEIPDDDGRAKGALIVYNRGQAPTTIRNLVLVGYRSPLHRVAGRTTFNGLVPNPGFNFPDPGVPHRLAINDSWMGRFYYNEMLTRARQQKQLYAGVYATHRKRPYLIRVRTPAEVAVPGNLYEDD